MPENNEELPEENHEREPGEDENPYEPDQDAINDGAEFAERYGFTHECECADDWASGNLGVIAVCYLNMCRDALEYLAGARTQIAELEAELSELRVQIADEE